MKKLILSMAMMVCSISSFAQFSSGGFHLDEEHVYYGVRFGLTASHISGDGSLKCADSKVGMTLGGVIGLRLTSNAPVFLESGLYYTERGGKKGDLKVGLNYLEIPVLVKYGIRAADKFTVIPFVGPYFSMAISGREKEPGVTSFSSFTDDHYRHPDMGFKLGCGVEYDNLYLELGYQIGVADISDDDRQVCHGNAFIANFGVNF